VATIELSRDGEPLTWTANSAPESGVVLVETAPIEPPAASEDSPPETRLAQDAPAEDADQESETAGDETPGETRVLVAEVDVAGLDGQPLAPELEDTVYAAIAVEPGRTITRSQLQRDINNVFATGVFANVRAVPDDTALGVRVTFLVQPNPVLTQVRVQGTRVLPDEVVEEIFSPQYGEIINLIALQDRIVELNEWYQANGYVLAYLAAAPQITPNGVVTLIVAEGVIESIQVRFLNEDGSPEDEDGNPIRGRTREFIIRRELRTQPGDVFRQEVLIADLERLRDLGLFEDIIPQIEPGNENQQQSNLILEVIERRTGSVAAGVGFNFTGDIFGTLSYRQDNFGGNNQKFSAETQLSTRGSAV
jgi:outer membrane protein insertion porin family